MNAVILWVSAEVLCYGHGAYGYGKNQQEKRWLERLEDCGDIPLAMVGHVFFDTCQDITRKDAIVLNPTSNIIGLRLKKLAETDGMWHWFKRTIHFPILSRLKSCEPRALISCNAWTHDKTTRPVGIEVSNVPLPLPFSANGRSVWRLESNAMQRLTELRGNEMSECLSVQMFSLCQVTRQYVMFCSCRGSRGFLLAESSWWRFVSPVVAMEKPLFFADKFLQGTMDFS